MAGNEWAKDIVGKGGGKSIETTCECGVKLKLPPSATKVRCPKCKHVLTPRELLRASLGDILGVPVSDPELDVDLDESDEPDDDWDDGEEQDREEE